MTCSRSGKHQPGASVCEIIYCMWNPQYSNSGIGGAGISVECLVSFPIHLDDFSSH